MNERKFQEVKGSHYLIIASAIVIGMWGCYFLEQNTSLRLKNILGKAQEEPMEIIFPIITSVIAPVIFLVLWRRAVGIVENGVLTTATVLSVGSKVQSMRDVVFQYVFDSETYETKLSVTSAISDELEPDAKIEILVDKRKPSRILVN